MLRVRRNVQLSTAVAFDLPKSFWLRVVRVQGLGAIVLRRRAGDNLTEDVPLRAWDDSWQRIGGYRTQVELQVDGSGSAPTTIVDFEWMDDADDAPGPLPPPATCVLVDETFTHAAIGATGVLALANTGRYPNGADVLGFRVDDIVADIASTWAGATPNLYAALFLRRDDGVAFQDGTYGGPDNVSLLPNPLTGGLAIRVAVKCGKGVQRSDTNQNTGLISTLSAPGLDSRYCDLMLLLLGGTITNAAGRLQMRGRPLR